MKSLNKQPSESSVYIWNIVGSIANALLSVVLLMMVTRTFDDTLLHETEIRVLHHRRQRRQIARIGQAVQAHDAVIRVFIQHVKYKVASNESGSAGYNNRHNL